MKRVTEPSKRTITYFAPCDPRQGMGGGARVDQMLAALERIGYAVKVVSYDGSGSLALTHGSLSVRTKLVKLSLPPRIPKLLKLMAVPTLVLLGLFYVKRHSLVIAHSPGIASGFIGLVVSTLKHGHLVVDFTDVKDNDTPKSVHELVLKSACIVFTVSRRLETQARHLGASTVVYLPTFLDLNRYGQDGHDRNAIRESLGISKEDRVVAYFGSFSRVEGLPVLLTAFATITEDVPNAKLLVAGGRNVAGADNVDRIVRDLRLEKKVILLSPQPYARVPMLMCAADLLVAPKIEAQENDVCDPTKVYEYLACGVPCVMSAVSEIAVIAQKADAAFVVEPGNPQALRLMMLRVLTDRKTADTYAARGRHLIESSYSIEKGSEVVRQALATHGILEPVPDAGETILRTPGDDDEKPQL